jgi:3-phosphoshikimate 1-carboxyvinyltransferase
MAALPGGETELEGLNEGEDLAATAALLGELGVEVVTRGACTRVRGPGVREFRQPKRPLDCRNSGTTMRLLAGILAACPFRSTLVGDASLSRRPMRRIVEPLERMGGRVAGERVGDEIYPPLVIEGGPLRPIRWTSEVASAQVKSAILLAAWVAGAKAEVTEPMRSRDHTERMLRALGENVRRVGRAVVLDPQGTLRLPSGRVPGDPSQGAFFAAAAAALPGSDLTLKGVCLNPTRLGFFRVLSRMGARVERVRWGTWCGEPVGDLRIRPGALRGVSVSRRSVPALLDEVPVLAVLAASACRGVTRIFGAEELRVKESDRISALTLGLTSLGGEVLERRDGLVITGTGLRGGTVDSKGDHRIAMAFRIAGLLSKGRVRIRGASSASVSHPGFDRELRRLTQENAR